MPALNSLHAQEQSNNGVLITMVENYLNPG